MVTSLRCKFYKTFQLEYINLIINSRHWITK